MGRWLAVPALFASLSVCASAQSHLKWSQVFPQGSPGLRSSHAMCFDSALGQAVLFGGAGTNDTWTYDGTDWSQVATTVAPTARSDHAMAYDAQRQVSVLFGGSTGGGETWEFNGSQWLQVFTVNSPSPRSGHRLAYDTARGVVVLFGGSTGGSETWEYDGTDWYPVLTASTVPAARTGHSMAYDSTRGRVHMFGGATTGWGSSDAWEFDGVDWTPVTGLQPSRVDQSECYFAARGEIVMHGGRVSCGGVFPCPWSHETWSFDGSQWLNATAQSGSPGRLRHAAICYDSTRGIAIMYGGLAHNGGYPVQVGGTWELEDYTPPFTATATSFGQGCGQGPLSSVPDPASRPIIGQNGAVDVVQSQTPFAAMSMGFANDFFGIYSLPVSLQGVGMSGCYLFHSAEVIGLGLVSGPSGLRFEYPIPFNAALLGSHAYLQAFAFESNANALQIVVSNAVDWHIGNQ